MSPHPRKVLPAPQAALGRRVGHRAFWAIWDHLFGVAGLGMLGGVLLLSIPGLVLSILPWVPPGIPVFLILCVGALSLVLAASWLFGGYINYARAAVVKESAHWSDFREGLKRPGVYLRCGIAVSFALVLLVVNGVFYFSLSGQGELGVPIQLAAATAGMVVFWAFVLAGFVLWAGLSDAKTETVQGTLTAVRLGVEVILVAPRAWFGALVLMGSLTVLAFLSVLGVVFVLPLLAVFGVAAAQVGQQHREFLLKAAGELGPDADLRSILRRTAELWEEWQARQPRRTLKHIVRPWEE